MHKNTLGKFVPFGTMIIQLIGVFLMRIGHSLTFKLSNCSINRSHYILRLKNIFYHFYIYFYVTLYLIIHNWYRSCVIVVLVEFYDWSYLLLNIIYAHFLSTCINFITNHNRYIFSNQSLFRKPWFLRPFATWKRWLCRWKVIRVIIFT